MQKKKAFSLLELLSVIVVIGILIAATATIVPRVTQRAKASVDKSTLATLNEALNQYKLVGGDVSVFTEGTPTMHAIERLMTPMTRFGHTQVFLQPGRTYLSASIDSTGYGAFYRFTRFDTYAMQGSAPKRAPDIPASSQNATISCGSSFTPTIVEGSPSGDYEMSWNGESSWSALAAYTPPSPGSYSFYVRNKYIDEESDTTSAGPYTLTVNSLSQATVSSSGGTITYGNSFTPSVSGGSGSGTYQMSWGDTSSWEIVGAHTPSATGTESFYVRRLSQGCYSTSAIEGPYTLTVNTANQASVSSANGSISCGGVFTPTTSGGSGTGEWQMYWTDVGSWQTLASRTFSTSGSYTFKVRKAGDSNYNTSSESATYTLTVSLVAQAAVTSADDAVSCGAAFTASATGGSGSGLYQIYWDDIGAWQTLAARTFTAAGSYTFQVRRAASGCYATSAASSTYTITVSLGAQAAVASASDTITYGESFTPSASGGSGSGDYEMTWDSGTTWDPIAAYTPSAAGSYNFQVRRLGDECYFNAATGAYTLTVDKADQAAVSSASTTISCGGSFTPTTSGGSGTGGWQMYWTDVGTWQTLAARTFSTAGSYTFRVRKLDDDDYNTSTQSALYTLTVNTVSQAAVSSANGTITYGSSFTPTTSGGSAGTWQMLWTDVGSWQTLAARSGLGAGSYTFRVRRAASGCYTTSSQSSLYTLTVNTANQAAVTSANGSINCGSSFTPSVSGGSGTGGWQMLWSDIGSWQTRASRTFSSSGSYTFRVRKLGDDNYNTSSQSSLYTLTVNALNQSSVSSSNGGTILAGESFTPSVSGGTTGTWEMYWNDRGYWQTRASRTFTSSGTYYFRVRRAASGCYNTSSQSSQYSLSVSRARVTAYSDYGFSNPISSIGRGTLYYLKVEYYGTGTYGYLTRSNPPGDSDGNGGFILDGSHSASELVSGSYYNTGVARQRVWSPASATGTQTWYFGGNIAIPPSPNWGSSSVSVW